MAAQLHRRWKGTGKEQYKVHAADLLDDEHEHVEPKITDEDKDLPRWLLFAKVAPKKYWTRPLLGGDERPRGVVSFFLDIFHWQGTVSRRVLPQALLSGAITGLVIGCQRYVFKQGQLNTLSTHFFPMLFLITLLVLAFRVMGAWHSYRKGHELVLQMQASAIDLLLTCTTSIHVRNSGMDLLEMVRRLNILLAFIRQDLRESRHHVYEHTTFKAGQKKSRLAKEWFYSEEDKFVKDPYGCPPLKLMLTPGEIEVYKKQSTTDRVLVCTIAIRTLFAKHINIGDKKMSTPDTNIFRKNLQEIVHSYGKCRELVRTPAPFVMHHLALFLTLLVTVCFAPLYFATNIDGWFPICASMILTYALYALEEAACEMEVPFGWRATDCNLSKMCRYMLKRSWTFCKICKISGSNPAGAGARRVNAALALQTNGAEPNGVPVSLPGSPTAANIAATSLGVVTAPELKSE